MLLMAGVQVAGSQPASSSAGRVDAIFSRYTTTTPGCSVGVAVKGETILERAYGMADLEHDTVLRPDSIIEAGSVSKQFTAAAVLLLARDGALSLDDPVRKHIPEVPDYGVPLTIRHLLTHTSGLRDWGTIVDLQGWARTTRAHTHAHVLEVLSRQRSLNFTPGTDWSYSNSGYNLAAMIVARVSGMSFAEFSRRRIFEPLGMRDTSWRDDYRRVVPRRAIAYQESAGVFSTLMPFENVHGNGGLLTTVGDLLRWNRNFASHVVGDATFVSEMERTARLADGRDANYGLGLFLSPGAPRREVFHSGSTAGYRAFLTRYPAEDVSVAVLCTVSSATAERFAHQVADLYLPARNAASAAAATTLPGEVLRERAGLYRRLDGPQVLELVFADDALRVSGGARLTPVSAQAMRQGDLEFLFGVDGSATRVRVTDTNARPRDYERVAPASVSLAQVAAYAGRYRSDEVDVAYEIVVDGGTLRLRRAPDDVFPLRPLFTDAFASEVGTLRFLRDPRGAVTQLQVTTDRAWAVTFTREPSAARVK